MNITQKEIEAHALIMDSLVAEYNTFDPRNRDIQRDYSMRLGVVTNNGPTMLVLSLHLKKDKLPGSEYEQFKASLKGLSAKTGCMVFTKNDETGVHLTLTTPPLNLKPEETVPELKKFEDAVLTLVTDHVLTSDAVSVTKDKVQL